MSIVYTSYKFMKNKNSKRQVTHSHVCHDGQLDHDMSETLNEKDNKSGSLG